MTAKSMKNASKGKLANDDSYLLAPPSEWSVGQVDSWLCDNNFQQYSKTLCRDHKVDGVGLLGLAEDEIKDFIPILGDVKRLRFAIHRLRVSNKPLLKALGLSGTLSPTSQEFETTQSLLDARKYMNPSALEPEHFKCFIAFCYMSFSCFVSAFCMVVAHDRVPDMDKYKPLPDFALDNIPHIPWAFMMCEVAGLILGAIWIVVLIFHKHRFILLRRMFSLMGTVFILRSCTICITSLSVPGRHLECKPHVAPDLWSKCYRAFDIFMGGGMLLANIRSCGDYMFSGHAAVVTILNFFVTEYIPSRMYWLHTLSWIMNLFAIFFILAGHEHYSIDVFVAFYITSRLFLYYHSLANNGVLAQQDRQRTRIWFPLFSYFESNCNCIVPNEYASPLLLLWPKPSKSAKKKSKTY